MENINISRIIARLQNRNLYSTNNRIAGTDINGTNTGFSASAQQQTQSLIRDIQIQTITQQQLKMNYLEKNHLNNMISLMN